MTPSISERLLAAVSHAIALLPVGPFVILVTLVYWLIVRSVSGFVNHHGREALNFQITYNIALVVLFAAAFVITRFHGLVNAMGGIMFFAILIAYGLFYLALIIVAIVSALLGKWYKYPMTFDFVK